MAKKIILFLSELKPAAVEESYICPDGLTVAGVQTNDAPVKYLLRAHPDVQEIICVVTPHAAAAAWDHFECEIHRTAPDVRLTAVPFSEGQEFAGNALGPIVKAFCAGDELILETTGGFRNAIMYLLLLSRVLGYTGVALSGAVYSNFHTKRIEDVSHLFRMFDLVNGMQELTNLGSVRTLRSYYGSHPADARIDGLLTAMEELTESITLCRTRLIAQRMEKFSSALEAAQDHDDPLMRQLIPVFQKKFGKKLNTTALIRWCVDSDMLQQALTVYTERMPEVFLRRGDIIQVDDSNIPDICLKDYEDRDVTIFLTRFLTMSHTDAYCRAMELPKKQMQTIEDMECLLVKWPCYKLKRPVENIQIICRDYLYIKALRNLTNHAGGGGDDEPTEMLDYLMRCGYQDPETVTMEDMRNILNQALDHLKPIAKKGRKK